jgi:tRNA-splicing endonuclease subunit Sen54
MHNAIAHPRLHHPKNQIIGVFAPGGPAPRGEDRKAAEKPKDGEKTSFNSREKLPLVMNTSKTKKTIGVPADACVYVANPKGQFFKTMGQADCFNRVWLLPEEALYLLERGTLDLRLPTSMTGHGYQGPEDDELTTNIPMSLQAAYGCLIGRGGLTLERFSVYTGLRRLGYTIIRSPSWDETKYNHQEPNGKSSDTALQNRIFQRGLRRFMMKQFYDMIPKIYGTDFAAQGPMIGLGTHRNYSEQVIIEMKGFRLNTRV